MNSYIFFRRIRWPILLLTFGVTALLNQWDILHFDQSWPLYLIVFGVLRLAEGAALSSPSAWPAPVYPAAPLHPQPGTGIVPAASHAAPYPPSVDEES